MALKPSHRLRRKRQPSTELNIIPTMSLMIILIPFLLLTAVFGRASILNLYLPTDPNDDNKKIKQNKLLIPQIVVMDKKLILSKGKGRGNIIRIPQKDGKHDYETLQKFLIQLREMPNYSENIIILPESKLRYQTLITTMDICREYKDEKGKNKALFPVISIGEYRPKSKSSKGKGT